MSGFNELAEQLGGIFYGTGAGGCSQPTDSLVRVFYTGRLRFFFFIIIISYQLYKEIKGGRGENNQQENEKNERKNHQMVAVVDVGAIE